MPVSHDFNLLLIFKCKEAGYKEKAMEAVFFTLNTVNVMDCFGLLPHMQP